MSTESLAEKVSSETPWWATAPIWLAAGIVGVPSLIAIGAGYFVASHVTTSLAAINQMEQSQLYLINEHMNETKRNFTVVLKFIDDDLRCQFQTCINSAKTPQQRTACVSPRRREQEYGLEYGLVPDPDK
jgi:hypothetical protein